MIDRKSLKVKMVKVKAYSRVWMNERADKLAKAAAFSASRLNLNYLQISGINLELTYNNLTLEAFSKCSIKSICEARHFYQLLQLYRNIEIKILTEHHH